MPTAPTIRFVRSVFSVNASAVNFSGRPLALGDALTDAEAAWSAANQGAASASSMLFAANAGVASTAKKEAEAKATLARVKQQLATANAALAKINASPKKKPTDVETASRKVGMLKVDLERAERELASASTMRQTAIGTQSTLVKANQEAKARLNAAQAALNNAKKIAAQQSASDKAAASRQAIADKAAAAQKAAADKKAAIQTAAQNKAAALAAQKKAQQAEAEAKAAEKRAKDAEALALRTKNANDKAAAARAREDAAKANLAASGATQTAQTATATSNATDALIGAATQVAQSLVSNLTGSSPAAASGGPVFIPNPYAAPDSEPVEPGTGKTKTALIIGGIILAGSAIVYFRRKR